VPLPAKRHGCRWASLLLLARRDPWLTGLNGGTALVLPPAFPPCAQLLPAAIPGNLTVAQ